jgi:AraC-like DNA-binding protein
MDMPEDALPYFRVLPDACVEIFINCSPMPIAHIKAGTTEVTYHRSIINFRLKTYADVRMWQGSSCIAICFHPAVAGRFFSFPTGIADGVLTLDDAWKNAGLQLEEQIALAVCNDDRVAIIQQYLEQLLVKNPAFDKSVAHCLWQANLYKGQLTANQLADRVGLSQRQLSRKFNSSVGISPKEFLRLSRFIHSLKNLHEEDSLTGVAYESGYYDQAHCIHEYKEFAGLTPGELREATHVLYC